MDKNSDLLKVTDGEIKINSFTIVTGTRLFRVHPSNYEGNVFNPSNLGNARFSPIRKLLSSPIHGANGNL